MAFLDPGMNVQQPPGPPPGPPAQAPRPPGMPAAFSAFLGGGQGGPQVSAPGPGNMADGVSRLHLIIEMLQQALPLLGTGTPGHQAALKATEQLTKVAAKSGGAPLGQLQTLWRDIGNQINRTGLLQQLMANNQLGQGGQPGGQQGGPPPGGPQGGPPPMPGGAFPGA